MAEDGVADSIWDIHIFLISTNRVRDTKLV